MNENDNNPQSNPHGPTCDCKICKMIRQVPAERLLSFLLGVTTSTQMITNNGVDPKVIHALTGMVEHVAQLDYNKVSELNSFIAFFTFSVMDLNAERQNGQTTDIENIKPLNDKVH